MIVLGVDPGVAITGYGVVRSDVDRLSLVTYGVIRTPPTKGLPERLCMIYQGLSDLISFHRPQAIAVEELFFGHNVRTAISVGEARGVVLLAAAHAHLPVHEYTPSAVKQAVVGYGNASKRQVQEMVRLLLELSDVPRPDDAADAVAVAICYIHSARMEELTASANKDA
ncbi:MAG: crossover junction endodeoxyribonuclease RuvC [Anaerolineae bacterium]|nr:crossover junction endodeoxyribonuclease RuvC [Anaerolineae bacterium]